jgi:hypothetical protein
MIIRTIHKWCKVSPDFVMDVFSRAKPGERFSTINVDDLLGGAAHYGDCAFGSLKVASENGTSLEDAFDVEIELVYSI